MLGFKERRELHKIIKTQNEILATRPPFNERRIAQKTKLDALKRLGIGHPQPTPPDFSAETDRIEALIGHDDFDAELDALVERLETSGVFAQYKTRLTDIATRDAIAAAGEWA